MTRLALPVAVAQVASMMLWFVDLLMVGRVGVEALDAVALGRTWIWTTLVVGMGMVFGIDPIASQGHGAKDRRTVGLSLQWGLVVGIGWSLPVGLSWLLTGPVLTLAGQDAHISALAHDYALVQIPGLPFFLVFIALRQWLQARGIMAPVMWISFLANGINVFANWLLIFGNWGFPELGSTGAGIATAVTQAFMAFGLVAVVFAYRLQRGGWTGWSREAWAPKALRRVMGYGGPVAIQIGLEFWAFGLSTLLAGLLSEVALASHTIAINLASFAFMVPLGVSVAAVTRVGNLIGARREERARLASWVALALGGGVMAVSAIGFVLGREALPRLYTADAAVIAACAAVLPIAAAFQVFDGVQVVGAGILRGMGTPRPAAVFNVIAYYVLALPAAWWWGFQRGGGLAGIWWAMCFGLGVSATLLVVWVYHRGPGSDRRLGAVRAVALPRDHAGGPARPGAPPPGPSATSRTLDSGSGSTGGPSGPDAPPG